MSKITEKGDMDPLTKEIDGLIDTKIVPRFNLVDDRFNQVDNRFNHVDEELKRVNGTLAGLGGDIAELRLAITDLTNAIKALSIVPGGSETSGTPLGGLGR